MQFVLNHTLVDEKNVPADLTILRYVRETKKLCGTKEGCASGDCGACTVLVGNWQNSHLTYRAINACIAPLASVAGKHLVTVEHLAKDGNLHPAQAAMVQCHASQCGFCTPGFVMSLAGLYQSKFDAGSRPLESADANPDYHPEKNPESVNNPQAASKPHDRAEICAAIAGNLCRCTGYRPIVDAAKQMLASPPTALPTKVIIDLVKNLETNQAPCPGYFQPDSVPALNRLLALHPSAKLIAGGTDLVLSVTQEYQSLPLLIDISNIKEMQLCAQIDGNLIIGAAVTYTQMEQHLAKLFPALLPLLARLGSRQIRNCGTLGGNLANASPIADMPPVLLCMDAIIEIGTVNGTRRQVALENFYLAYKQTVLQASEYIIAVHIPAENLRDFHRFYKVSKRIEDDISSVLAAIRFTLADGVIKTARIAFGGVAATPIRVRDAEAKLSGAAIDCDAALAQAMEVVKLQLQPLSDVRASADYRLAMAVNLLRKTWFEAQGEVMPNMGTYLTGSPISLPPTAAPTSNTQDDHHA